MPGSCSGPGAMRNRAGARLQSQWRWPPLLDMVREAIGPPDQGNVACECTSTSAASATRRAPPPWWVSTHLVTHTARRMPLIPAMRLTACLATSPKPPLQTCAALRSSKLRANTHVAVRVHVAGHTPAHAHAATTGQACSKRMYIRMSVSPFHTQDNALGVAHDAAMQRPERPRTGLRVTQIRRHAAQTGRRQYVGAAAPGRAL